MRILHYATEDCRGGAAKVAYYVHRLCIERGHSSHLVVRDRATYDDPSVVQVPVSPWKYRLDRIRRRIPGWRQHERHAKAMFNFDDPDHLNEASFLCVPREEVDVIFLHWITGFLSVKRIRRIYEHYQCPMLWVMNDQQPITGGCHYSMDCDGYTRECGNCPLLDGDCERDASRTLWLRKRQHLSSLPITFWCGSSGTVRKMSHSSLFGGHERFLLPGPINDQVFRPLPQVMAREVLRLPKDKRVIFLGATQIQEERKGMKHAVEALKLLHAMLRTDERLRPDDVWLAVAGHGVDKLAKSLPFPVTDLGFIQDSTTLALAYQAADVFVCPTLDDEGPMMVSESLLCGTPVVMFQTGIATEVIRQGQTGFAARMADSDDLARGLKAVLAAGNQEEMRMKSRTVAVQAHSPSLVMDRLEATLKPLLQSY